MAWRSSIIARLSLPIFTTNYDLCVDKFLRGKTHYDGFADTMGYGRVFASEWPELAAVNSDFTLCKLHGSINWFEVNGRATHLPFAPAQSLMEDTVTGRMMVYPATEKYALTSPYAECLFYFRQCLFFERRQEPVVVVGYSFRDAPINNAFVDALKVNPNLKIISLRPQADAHQYDLEPSLRSNVMPVDAKFGEDYSIEALRKALF